jgi:hypothetical protein
LTFAGTRTVTDDGGRAAEVMAATLTG